MGFFFSRGFFRSKWLLTHIWVFTVDFCVFIALSLPCSSPLLFLVINSLVQVLRTENRLAEFCKCFQLSQTRWLCSALVPFRSVAISSDVIFRLVTYECNAPFWSLFKTDLNKQEAGTNARKYFFSSFLYLEWWTF